jgi:hypothetical protein
MKCKPAILVTVFALTGCFSLPQTRILSSQPDLTCHIQDGGLSIAWKSDSLEPSEQADFDSASSWALSSSGEKYAFNTVERTYFTGQKSYWKDTTLFLRKADAPMGTGSKKWSNGIWTVHLAFTPRVPRKPIETKIEISGFLYNPIVHGLPN